METTILTVSYTEHGKKLANQIASMVENNGYTAIRLHRPQGIMWMESYWKKVDQIVFVGAAGIAVRIAAPCLHDKMTDPGLIVVDEKGKFFIPILSGHVGGANAFAVWLSQILQGTPVLTTATDVRGCFAVDTFAKCQGLIIADRTKIKMISSAILRGETIGLHCTYPIVGKIPEELHLYKDKELSVPYKYNLVITERPKEYDTRPNTLCICQRNLVLGIGCKKGTSFESLKHFVQAVLKQLQAESYQVLKVVSIDLKENEKGLIELADDLGVMFTTYSKEILQRVEEVSEESEFVKEVTGIGNVCERAALYECRDGRLLFPKYAKDGMTIAVAAKNRGINFE